ncbi:MAG: Gfo/Idh/MocA family oxidoreductase [Gemmataceae bacterium]
MSASRRAFLKTSVAAAAASPLIVPTVHAAGSDTLRLGIVGVGGRGSGAVGDAMRADPNTKLVAACDIFEDRLASGLKNLKAAFKDRIDVGDRQYTGFEGYKQVIDSDVDVVLLTTSPGFRPLHFAYAVDKGKHVFMEKPHATDASGVRSVLESAKKAKDKNLAVCSGFTYRYDLYKRETVKRIHDGMIGKVAAIHTTYNTGPLWHRHSKTNDPKEMEYQLRNWYYFTWLSGDFLVEQHIHNIDKLHWVMNGELPIAAHGQGGREVRTDPKYGNIFDHFTVVYEYPNGVRAISQCRQTKNCENGVIDYVMGTKGQAELMDHKITTNDGGVWEHPHNDKHNLGDAYVQEHRELYQSIRAGKPMNDAERSAKSTLMAIMGREAAYTGKKLTWKQMLESKQNLQPATYSWGPNPDATIVATPGVTKFA